MQANPMTIKNFLSKNYINDIFSIALKNKNINRHKNNPPDNIHLIVPFYRKHLYEYLIKNYEKQNIIFHPICDDVDIEPFKNNKFEWIKPLLCPPLKNGEQCYKKINDFIEDGDIVDNDLYGFCGDDDMYEPNFATELKKSKADIVFISRYAGDKIPNDGAPHFLMPLITKNIYDVYPGHIGLGQFFLRGNLLKKLKFRIDTGWGDGLFAQLLMLQNKSIEFRPDIFLFINYFQVGRYNDKSKMLKSNWELPYEENTVK